MAGPYTAASRSEGPELFFGIASAIGTDSDAVVEVLKEVLAEVSYNGITVRLSKILATIEGTERVPDSPEEARYSALMDAGNRLREKAADGGALAVMGVQWLRDHTRKPWTGDTGQPVPRHAYVFQGLKHPREVDVLREIYRSGFFLIGVYSSREHRTRNLARRFADSRYSQITSEHLQGAEKLVSRDEKEEGNSEYGQDVQDTFPKADIFIDADRARADLRSTMERFVAILFGYPYHTPSPDEYCMFHAHAASVRSSALGRQVGAVIARPRGQIISIGTNEVPSAKGGQYWEGDRPDGRDFQLGKDSSEDMKLRNLAEILQRLDTADWLVDEQRSKSLDIRVQDARKLMKGTRIMSPIEFGRTVHAEMAALLDAARRGVPVAGATLYTTTFPCHNCAMHIIASGIARVVFIEPYPKSLATELFHDSICIGGGSPDKLSFDPFVGIAPSRYLSSFAVVERKNPDGTIRKWNKNGAWPQQSAPTLSYMEEEDARISSLGDVAHQLPLEL